MHISIDGFLTRPVGEADWFFRAQDDAATAWIRGTLWSDGMETEWMTAYFRQALDHRGWANRRTLASVMDCPAAHPEATPIVAHLLAAEHIWLSRLQGNEPALPVWPTLTLNQCQTLAGECDVGWAHYIGVLTDDKMNADMMYRNSRGEQFRNKVMDVLTHVFTHGQYHRGQIAKMVGRAGGAAASTDFIVYVRSSYKPAIGG
jgi:uncharacterized damage-inducible protein DinB